MEKEMFYQGLVECEEFTDEQKQISDYLILGVFKSRKDADIACRLYYVAFNNLVGTRGSIKCTGAYKIKGYEYPKGFDKNANIMTVSDFVAQNNIIKGYKNFIGDETFNNFLSEMGAETKQEKELRIIDTMLNDYNAQLQFAKKDNLKDETIEKLEERVQFLESLRDEKRFTK